MIISVGSERRTLLLTIMAGLSALPTRTMMSGLATALRDLKELGGKELDLIFKLDQ